MERTQTISVMYRPSPGTEVPIAGKVTVEVLVRRDLAAHRGPHVLARFDEAHEKDCLLWLARAAVGSRIMSTWGHVDGQPWRRDPELQLQVIFHTVTTAAEQALRVMPQGEGVALSTSSPELEVLKPSPEVLQAMRSLVEMTLPDHAASLIPTDVLRSARGSTEAQEGGRRDRR